MATTSKIKLGFLGAGQMALALADGWLKAGLLSSADCRASDPSPAAASRFHERTGIPTVPRNIDVLEQCDVIVLAVKPQMMSNVLDEIRTVADERHLFISIAAGFSTRRIADGLGATHRIVRVMPNTPCLIGASATGLTVGPGANPDDGPFVKRFFDAVGLCYELPEHLLDAVTGLSGSGPAFIYLIIEALSDGGVKMGLPREVALTLAAQTVLGAARMALETKTHPGVLKDTVASPGGTTIAGLHQLERAGVRGAIIDAVEAAAKRSAELGS
jgi:pyrroline-5-carboxylate reductase